MGHFGTALSGRFSFRAQWMGWDKHWGDVEFSQWFGRALFIRSGWVGIFFFFHGTGYICFGEAVFGCLDTYRQLHDDVNRHWNQHLS